MAESGTHGDEREELGRLATALAAHVRRRRHLGQARVVAPEPPPAPEPEPATRREPQPSRPAAARAEPASSAPRGERTETPPQRRAPTFAGAASSDTGADRAATGAPASSARAAVDARAAEVREAAAACPDLESLARAVSECTACNLCHSRTQTVFADGNGRVPVMFVGEAPGENEDRQGVPFVGRAGALLTDIITKGMGLERSQVTIANVLKCRPPENRDPSESEKRLCTSWLDRQIELIQPKVLIALGRHAAGHLLDSQGSMGSMRGKVHERRGQRIVATYHPAYLLRSPHQKKACWQDIQLAMRELGLEPPKRAPQRP